jgi:hypothetical protein
MTNIKIFDFTGTFAENKDMARDIRVQQLIPVLKKGEEVIIDFTSVTEMTQSFCHALLSDVIRKFGIDVLDRLSFSNCELAVKRVIEIVVEYMQ